MKNIRNKSHTITLKNKLLISYILLMLIPMILVTSIITITYKKTTLEKISTQTALNLDKLSTRFNECFRSIGSVLNQTLLDTQLEEIALPHYKSTFEIFQAYYPYNTFDGFLKYYDEISSIKLYCYNDTLLNNGQFVPIDSSIYEKNWFKKVSKNQGKILWQYDKINSLKDAYHLTYELRGVSTYDKLGILSIELDHDFLNSLVSQEYFDTFIFGSKGEVISSNVTDLSILKTLNISLDSLNTLDVSENPFDIMYNGEASKLLVKHQKINHLNLELTLISIIPENFITQDMLSSLFPSAIILIISSSLSILLIIFFTRTITRRISKLCYTMDSVAEGNFNVTLDIDGNDEVSRLYINLKKMILNINTLVNEVYHTNLQKKQLLIYQKDMQLQMLSNQINPHFLFNTLESIRMQAHSEGNVEIADAIEALAFMIRRNLDSCKELIPISYELEILETYLKLIQFRFGDRITYTIQIPKELMAFSIPYLIIQPLVENAIVHSLEKKAALGHIDIIACNILDEIHIEVIDNGEGIEEDKLKALLETLHENVGYSNKHIGLKNINSRIKLTYGNPYGITIKSIPGLGTSVKIILPNPSKEGNYAKSDYNR